MSPSNPIIPIEGPAIRTWVDATGKEWHALAPDLLAITAELRREGTEPTQAEVELRRREYTEGSRLPSGDLIADTLSVDEQQRLNGWDGPPLVFPGEEGDAR
jgi:hypothetical protein